MQDSRTVRNVKPSKLNIAHFIGSLHIGGAENQVVLLINALNELGHNCHVIVMHDEDGYKETLNDNVKYYNIAYRTRYAPAGWYRLYTYLVNNNIDILHCHMYHTVSKAALLGRLAKVSVIVSSEHGKNTWKKWYHHMIEKYLVNRFLDKRIAVSEDIRIIRIQDDGVDPENIIVLPNSVNTSVPIADNTKKPKILGSLGRLVDAKDFGNLINAFNILIKNGHDVELVIGGEGVERKSIESLVDKLCLTKYIKIPGIMSASSFFASIDIFVMSSKREGVPVALLEAMSHGLPIASTSVGGIPEVITHNVDGLLCKAGDSNNLAEILTTLIESMEIRKRLGVCARKKVIKYYSKESVVIKWNYLYSTLIENKRV